MINDIVKVVDNIGVILQYFVSGFCFIQIFKVLTSKKLNINMTILMSCVFSYIGVAIITTINVFWFHSSTLNNPLVISGISIILSIILGFFLSKLFLSDRVKTFVVKHFNRNFNDDIMLDILDFKNGSNLKIYLKDKNCYIIGSYKCHEEKRNDSWIALTGHGRFQSDNNEVIEPSYIGDKNVTITIRFSDIEYMEIFQ